MRRLADRGLTLFAGACAAAAVALSLGVLLEVLRNGLPALSLEFLLAPTAEAGAAGGIRYQIAGTAILVATAVATAAPLALAVALTATVYLGDRFARWIRNLLLMLQAMPSILLGIFGMILFSQTFGWGKSWLAGGLLLAAMILPTVAMATIEAIDSVPPERLEAAVGLGLDRSQVVRAVLLPRSRQGLVSGLLLGLARAAGETAPILFTAAVFSGATLPAGVVDSPVLALPYHIFTLAQDTLAAGAKSRLWAAAFVLVAMVLAASLAALPIRLGRRGGLGRA